MGAILTGQILLYVTGDLEIYRMRERPEHYRSLYNQLHKQQSGNN